MQQIDNENNILIKDIMDLKEKQKNKQELRKEIEELAQIKSLKRIEQEELELHNKISKLSTYEMTQIGNIIAKLMTQFEGIPYHCIKNDWAFRDCNYCIEPKDKKFAMDSIYPNYKLKGIDSFLCSKAKTSLCLLQLSTFTSNNRKITKHTESYIQVFIDYLYEKRSSQSLYEISIEKLDEFLQEFLEMSKILQLQRKEEIENLLEKRWLLKKREEYEKSCLIDRKLIFNSLAYIINHYEENMSAIQETEEEWSRSNQWSELYGYHKLTIKFNGEKVFFKTKVDSVGVYPDEEYCGVYVNVNKDTNICFFDIKRVFMPILNNSNYAINFMNMIEEIYGEKCSITAEDIHTLFVSISNEHKSKQKMLRMKKS